MLERLGRAIYWFALALGSLYAALLVGSPLFSPYRTDYEFVVVRVIFCAILVFIGRLVRYVLANE